MLAAAAANLVLSLVLTPELGLEGPALATALPFFAAFPVLLRLGLRASGAALGEVLGRAYLPALVLGADLALALGLARLAFDPDTLPLVLGLVARRAAALLGRLLPARARPGRARVRARLPQAPRLSSAQARRPRSRSDTISSSPAGHSIPTAGSSKRKPDSRAGS